MTLKTDYKDYQFQEGETLRKYQQISNDDGTISFRDVTSYQQEGDRFSASDINSTNTKVNDLDQDASELQSDTYFNVGETLTIPNVCIVQGFITGASKKLFFILPLQKSLKNISSATFNSIEGTIRVNPYFTLSDTTLNIVGGDYASGTTSTPVDLLTFATRHTIVINKEVGCLVLQFIKDDGWGCPTNTNCSVEIRNVSITLN